MEAFDCLSTSSSSCLLLLVTCILGGPRFSQVLAPQLGDWQSPSPGKSVVSVQALRVTPTRAPLSSL